MDANHQRYELLRRIQELEFIGVELTLYLDTHPDDANALTDYNRAAMELVPLRRQYEQLYGPLTSYASEPITGNKWRWIDDPWPWEM